MHLVVNHGEPVTWPVGNAHNTFRNCKAKYNTSQQFYQMPGTDDYTTISGGEFCCSRGQGSGIMTINSNNVKLQGARIYDDLGKALHGLFLGDSKEPVVIGNTFGGFPRKSDIITDKSTVGHLERNVTPDGVTIQGKTGVVLH